MVEELIAENIVKKIKQKKELSGLSEKLVLDVLNAYLLKNNLPANKLSSLSEKGLKIIVKDVRADLRRFSGQYQSSSMDFRKKLILLKEGKIRELLMSHSSTKERLDFYPELKKIIESLEVKSILDIGCGLNPLALASPALEYYAIDIKEDEIHLIERFFIANKIKGSAFVHDIRAGASSLPKAGLCLLFKILDILDNHKTAEKIILEVQCKYVLISFPTRTLSGKPMNHVRRPWLERILKKLDLPFKNFKSENEIFYLIEKK